MESAEHPPQLHFAMSDASQVGEARRGAALIAKRLGLDEHAAGQLALAVTELGTNILKHAGTGHLLVRPVASRGVTGVEVLALDKGPGIGNLAESLRDGHSTAGSPGNGLGALARLSPEFEVFSQAGRGAALRVVVWPRGPHGRSSEQAMICVAKRTEEVCGDNWRLSVDAGRQTLVVADGLGHGADAAIAARAAVETAAANPALAPAPMIEAIHDALRQTRGAAGAVVTLDPRAGEGRYCGVGNIACTVVQVDGKSRSLVSHNGILGHQMRRVQEFPFDFPPKALLIAHSDGLSARWSLSSYPGLASRHPGLIAAVLFRDAARESDDATVVVLRNSE